MHSSPGLRPRWHQIHKNFGGIRLAVFEDLNALKLVFAEASLEIGPGVRTHEEGTQVTAKKNIAVRRQGDCRVLSHDHEADLIGHLETHSRGREDVTKDNSRWK